MSRRLPLMRLCARPLRQLAATFAAIPSQLAGFRQPLTPTWVWASSWTFRSLCPQMSGRWWQTLLSSLALPLSCWVLLLWRLTVPIFSGIRTPWRFICIPARLFRPGEKMLPASHYIFLLTHGHWQAPRLLAVDLSAFFTFQPSPSFRCFFPVYFSMEPTIHARLQKLHPPGASLRRLLADATSRRALRFRNWRFTSRLTCFHIRHPSNVFSSPFEHMVTPPLVGVSLVVHFKLQIFQPGPLPSFTRVRGSSFHLPRSRISRTTRTFATEMLIADSTRQRLRILARRRATTIRLPAYVLAHVTRHCHVHAIYPFDVFVPWDERVVSLDAVVEEFIGYLPAHLRIESLPATSTSYFYTSCGRVVHTDIPTTLTSVGLFLSTTWTICVTWPFGTPLLQPCRTSHDRDTPIAVP